MLLRITRVLGFPWKMQWHPFSLRKQVKRTSSTQKITIPGWLSSFPLAGENHITACKYPVLQEKLSAGLHSGTHIGLKFFLFNENNREVCWKVNLPENKCKSNTLRSYKSLPRKKKKKCLSAAQASPAFKSIKCTKPNLFTYNTCGGCSACFITQRATAALWEMDAVTGRWWFILQHSQRSGQPGCPGALRSCHAPLSRPRWGYFAWGI